MHLRCCFAAFGLSNFGFVIKFLLLLYGFNLLTNCAASSTGSDGSSQGLEYIMKEESDDNIVYHLLSI